MKEIQFDDERARTYRKCAEVLGFRSEAAFIFLKEWGEQKIRAGGWVIVPLRDGKPSDDVYGCDAEAFEQTYEPSPTGRPNQYRKTETVRAYQPGAPFEVDTVLADGHVEVQGSASSGSRTTWLVKAPGGEIYPVEDEEFRDSYTEAD